MSAVRLRLVAREPFADDRAGFGYFATDLHYQHLARAIAPVLGDKRGILVLSGEPAADGAMLARQLGALMPQQKAAVLRATAEMSAGPNNWFVPKDSVPYPLWNQLLATWKNNG